MAYRIETGRLDKAERTPQGGLRVPARVGRVGVLTYTKPDGSAWREYRPPEEAFSARSLASLRGAPVTDLHPSQPITPTTYRSLTRGHVGDDPRQDDDGRHVAASLYVLDADLMARIEAGEREEVSAGYNTDLDLTPGVSPDGEPYDAVQRNVTYNHVAVGPKGWGRAGPTVALRLDGDLNAIVTTPADAGSGKERNSMKLTLRVDGVDFVVEADETAARALPAALAKERDQAETWRKAAEAEKSRADAAEKARDEAKGRADSLEDAAKKAADPKAISELVAKRVDLEKRASLLKPDVKTDGLTDRALMVEALAIEGLSEQHSDDYVRARFDAAVEQAERVDSSLRETRAVATHADGGGQLSEVEAAQARHIARNRDGWLRKEAV